MKPKHLIYEVIDSYEGVEESLGLFGTEREAKARIREQVRDTDGECACRIVKIDAKAGEESSLQAW